MRRIRVSWVVVITLAVSTVFISCGAGSDGESAASGSWGSEGPDGEPPAIAVEGLEVSRGSILQRIGASGTVRGVEEADVVSEVEGMILETRFSLGDSVAEDELLVSVESTLAGLQLEEARGAYESARIDLGAVERRFENGSASQIELSRARSATNGARARLQAAEKTYNDHTIQAPISGLIASRQASISRGNYLTRGSVVARIVDLTVVEMEIAVGEQELAYLATDAPTTVRIPACGDEPIPARVASIAAGADKRTGSFPVIVRWENRCEDLRSGMSATVEIEAQEKSPGIVIPDSAIRRHDGAEFVFVARAGTVSERAITTGRRLGDRTQVRGGLDEGEVIVTSALTALTDGSAVEVTVRGTTGEVL